MLAFREASHSVVIGLEGSQGHEEGKYMRTALKEERAVLHVLM